MALRRKPKIAATPGVEGMLMEMPIVSTEIQLGKFATDAGTFVMLNCSTVLVRGTFALDRSQALTLGAELLKAARSIPSAKEKKKIAVPHPENETVLDSGLVLPA